MQASEPSEISGRLRDLFASHLPEFPPGSEISSSALYYGYGLSRNLMEAQFDAINSPLLERWNNGSYLAATDRGVEVDLGLENVTEEGSFHFLRGTW